MKKLLKCFLILFPFFVMSIVCLIVFLPSSASGSSLSAVETSSTSSQGNKGGVIYLGNGAKYEMRGGVIKGNTAPYGAIYVSNGAQLDIYGGSISDNGTAIYVESGGVANIMGGYIFDTIDVEKGGTLSINRSAHVLNSIYFDSDIPINLMNDTPFYPQDEVEQGYFPQRPINIVIGSYIQNYLTNQQGYLPILSSKYQVEDVYDLLPFITIKDSQDKEYLPDYDAIGNIYVVSEDYNYGNNYITFTAELQGRIFAVPAFDMTDADHFENSIKYYYRKSADAVTSSLTLYGFVSPTTKYYIDEANIVHLSDGDTGKEIWRVGVRSTMVENMLWYQTGEELFSYNDYNSFGDSNGDALEVGKTYEAHSGDEISAIHKYTDDELYSQTYGDWSIEFSLSYGILGPTYADYNLIYNGNVEDGLWGQRGFAVSSDTIDQDTRFSSSTIRDVVYNKAFSYRYNADNNKFEFSSPDDTEFNNPENFWATIEAPKGTYMYGHMVLRVTNLDNGSTVYIGASETPKTIALPDPCHVRFEILPLDETGRYYFPSDLMEEIVNDHEEEYNYFHGNINRARTNVTVLLYNEYGAYYGSEVEENHGLIHEERMMILWLWYSKNWGEAGYDMFYKIVQGYYQSSDQEQYYQDYIQAEFDMLCNSKTYVDPIYTYWNECRPEIDIAGFVYAEPQINIISLDGSMDLQAFVLNHIENPEINKDALSELMWDAIVQMYPFYNDFDFIIGPVLDISVVQHENYVNAWNELFSKLSWDESMVPLSCAYDDNLLPLSYDVWLSCPLYVVTNMDYMFDEYDPTYRLTAADIYYYMSGVDVNNKGMILPEGFEETYSNFITLFQMNESNCACANIGGNFELIDKFAGYVSDYYSGSLSGDFLFIVSSEEDLSQIFASAMERHPFIDRYQTLHIYGFEKFIDFSDEATMASLYGTNGEIYRVFPKYKRLFAFNRSVGGNWEGEDEMMKTTPELLASMIYRIGTANFEYENFMSYSNYKMTMRKMRIIGYLLNACDLNNSLDDLYNLGSEYLRDGCDFLDIVV